MLYRNITFNQEGKAQLLKDLRHGLFLSSLATLVAVGLATHFVQRNDDYLGDVPSFRAE